MGKNKKRKKKIKPIIRKIRFSLKIKITLLVVFLLIFTVAIISNFVIRHQNKILDDQLTETMEIYLETFKKNAETLLLEKKDTVSLQFFIYSYKNIDNFKMAMFVDNDGYIIAHNKVTSVLQKIYDSSKTMLYNAYEEKTHVVFRTETVTSTMSFDGFMPVYMDLSLPPNSQTYLDFQEIRKYHRLFKENRLFFKQDWPEELKNNFAFIKEFDNIYRRLALFNDEMGINDKAEKWLDENKIKQTELDLFKKMQKLFTQYKSGKEFILSENTFNATMEALNKFGLPIETVEKLEKLKDKGLLFSNKGLISNDTANELKFIVFLKNFIFKYMEPSGAAKNRLIGFIELVKSLEIRSGIDDNYYIGGLKSLLSKYDTMFLKYRDDGMALYETSIDDTFKILYGFYRIGSVRIILDLTEIEKSKKEIVNNTIDIAIIFIIRIIIFTFLFVASIINPLKALADETDEIVLKLEKIKVGGTEEEFNRSIDELKGYLDKTIDIKSRDELGQLADKFNIMTKKFKITFEEVQEKYRMGAEMEHAKEIQDAMLPKSFPDIENYKFSVYYDPQTESGGDYYDFVEIDDERFGIIVADVTSHGVGAAMVMAILKSAMRTSAEKTKYASKVIKEINPILFRDTPSNMFATVFYGVMNHKTREMFYSIAGHNQGIIYNPDDGKIKLMKAGGMPVGMMDSMIFDPVIEEFKTRLNKGDYFIQYSDGITEGKSINDEEYEERRFFEAIKKYCSDDLEQMKDNIIKDLKNFTKGAEQSDDITLLIVRIG